MYTFSGCVIGLIITSLLVGSALMCGYNVWRDVRWQAGGTLIAFAVGLHFNVLADSNNIFIQYFSNDVRSLFPCMKGVGTKINWAVTGVALVFFIVLMGCNYMIERVAEARYIMENDRHRTVIALTVIGFVVTKGLFHFQLIWNMFQSWKCSPDLIEVNWVPNYASYLILYVGSVRWWRFLSRRKSA